MKNKMRKLWIVGALERLTYEVENSLLECEGVA